MINSPRVIPADGLLAIGTGDSEGSATSFGNFPDSLTDAAGTVWTGAGTELQIPLGDDRTQVVTVWKPDGVPAVGAASVTFSANEAPFRTSEIGVVATSDVATLTLSERSIALDRNLTPRSSASCGSASLTSSYSQVPVIAAEFELEGGPAVIGQHFLRAERGGVDSATQFAPFADVDDEGLWRSSQWFSNPQDEYCMHVDVFSLRAETIDSYGPYCVPDDGRDWVTPIAATREQIDAELVECDTPPASLLARYCALHAELGTLPDGCAGFTQEELDAALDAEPDVSSLAGEPRVNPGLPGAPVVSGGTNGAGNGVAGSPDENSPAAAGGSSMGSPTGGLVPAGGASTTVPIAASGGATSPGMAAGANGEDGPQGVPSGDESGLSGVSSSGGCATVEARTNGSGALGATLVWVALAFGAARKRSARR